MRSSGTFSVRVDGEKDESNKTRLGTFQHPLLTLRNIVVTFAVTHYVIGMRHCCRYMLQCIALLSDVQWEVENK